MKDLLILYILLNNECFCLIYILEALLAYDSFWIR